MKGTNDQAINFWTEFDNNFHYAIPQEISRAYEILFLDKFTGRTNMDVIYNSWSDHRSIGDYPESFKEAFEPLKEQISYLWSASSSAATISFF